MAGNFLSLSGISTFEQVNEIGHFVSGHISMPVVIGLQVSDKLLKENNPNPRQPNRDSLPLLRKAARSYKGVDIAIHYYTRDMGTFEGDIRTILNTGLDPSGVLFQFNTLPPTLEQMALTVGNGFRNIFPVSVLNKKELPDGYLFWKGDSVVDSESKDPTKLLEESRQRKEFFDYVLFDPSRGTGKSLSTGRGTLANNFGKIFTHSEEFKEKGLIYAGKLSPDVVSGKVMDLTDEISEKRISVDVESGIRSEDNTLNSRMWKLFLLNGQNSLNWVNSFL